MAKKQHLDILRQGSTAWNSWRKEHPDLKPDLSQAILNGATLSKANLSETNLCGADLNHADMWMANLNRADLTGAMISRANLTGAILIEADLSHAILIETRLDRAYLNDAKLYGANLHRATLKETNLFRANLQKANLGGATLIRAYLGEANLCEANLCETNLTRTNLCEANLTNCWVYGTSVLYPRQEGAIQINLKITSPRHPDITVDDLEVAQFIYLLLNNAKIRDVIDTITSKVVLILGRFTVERKVVLDAIRDKLRSRGYVPVLFDFDEPKSRDVTETVTTLARMARFIIADITDPRSIPQELAFIVPNLPSVPVQPLLHGSQTEYGMFDFFTRFPWVLPIYHYTDQANLLKSLNESIIGPVEKKARELAKR